ncbi:MAG: hypothetical protein methR_P0596 [Methyloprofundus sp.]|nr:MAG: hypothetical protein methR_P0596 [Methyloprofundus sp.]
MLTLSKVYLITFIITVVGCSTTTETKNIPHSEKMICGVPKFSRIDEGKMIAIQLVAETESKQDKLTQECTSYYETLTQKILMETERELAKGEIYYASINLAIGLPLFVLADSLSLGTSGKWSTPECISSLEAMNVKSKIITSGKFNGTVTLVSVEHPENSQILTITKRSRDLKFVTDPMSEDYLLHIDGKFSNELDECTVDSQVLMECEYSTKNDNSNKCIINHLSHKNSNQPINNETNIPNTAIEKTHNEINCIINSDCQQGYSCRVVRGGGTECRKSKVLYKDSIPNMHYSPKAVSIHPH